MTTDPLTARIATALGEHEAIGYDDCDGCLCGADVRTQAAYRAHVAQILAELVGGDGLRAPDGVDGHSCIRVEVYMAAKDAERSLRAGVEALADECQQFECFCDGCGSCARWDVGDKLRALLDQRGEGEK